MKTKLTLFILLFSLLATAQTCEGQIQIAIGQVNIQSNDQQLGGRTLEFTTLNCGNEEQEVHISPDLIAQALGDQTIDGTVIIRQGEFYQEARWTVTGEGIPVYRYTRHCGTILWYNQNLGAPGYTYMRTPEGCSNQWGRLYWYYRLSTSRTLIGTAYRLGYTTIPYFSTNITITKENGQETVLNLNSNQRTNSIQGTVRVEYLGGLIDYQIPTSPYANLILFRDTNNQFSIKDAGILSMAREQPDYYTTNSYNERLTRALNREPILDEHCEFGIREGENYLYCIPDMPFVRGMFKYSIRDGTLLSLIENVGTPHIQAIENRNFKPPNKETMEILFQNLGRTDTFEFSLQCPIREITLRSQTFTVREGQSTRIPIEIEGTHSVIQDCTLTARSTSNPDVTSEMQLTITIEPFCDKEPPSENHIRVMTEKGCQYVCPNQYIANIDETTCQAIPTARDENKDTLQIPQDYLDARTQITHCTGEGTYTTMHNYGFLINDILYENKQTGEDTKLPFFIPRERQNQIFIAQDAGVPICRYVAKLGYTLIQGETTEYRGIITRGIFETARPDIVQEPEYGGGVIIAPESPFPEINFELPMQKAKEPGVLQAIIIAGIIITVLILIFLLKTKNKL